MTTSSESQSRQEQQGKQYPSGRNAKRRKAAEAFWNGYWLDMRGRRIGPIRREEYRELWRLWQKHSDIRLLRRLPASGQRSGRLSQGAPPVGGTVGEGG